MGSFAVSLNTTCNDEAIRIWTTLPVSQWRTAIEALPERKVIYGVTWQYRLAVRERLATGWRLRNSPVIWQGLDARLLISATAAGLRADVEADRQL